VIDFAGPAGECGLPLVEYPIMKRFLELSGILELGTGIFVLAAPALFTLILFGKVPDSPSGLACARIAGAALLSLGVACWLGRRSIQDGAVTAIIAAMLTYNVIVSALLLWLRYGADMTGIGLLPASALHIALAFWSSTLFRLTWVTSKHSV
jgi:hypothetical protein